jgi:Protein of unknown function (DUF4242)
MYNGKSAILWQASFMSSLETVESNWFAREPNGGVMKRYMIERDIPRIGTLEREQWREGAAKSNQVLRQLGPDIQWVESFVTANKMYCMYLATDEALIRRHAELSGFPASKVSEVGKLIDPTTAELG